MKTLNIVDLFCGAGGTSTGIIEAVKNRMHRPIHLTAVNHWQTAINSHRLNHPEVTHICEPVENIHPRTQIKSGRLDLLAASCECTFHSNARGGGPCNEQSRSQPWQLIRWATDIHVANILMENVREFMNWGPLNRRTQRPLKSRKGEFFKAFINSLLNLGYNVDFKVQSCADFGDPTTRQRLILIARKRKPVTWPEPTHGPGRSRPWLSARNHVIDWSLKGKSLFNDHGTPRLCANTVNRIYKGFAMQGSKSEPFLVMLRGTSKTHVERCSRSLDEPVPTITAGGLHLMLCEPFNRFALVEPIIVQTDHTGGNGKYCRTVDNPISTIVSKQNMLLVEPVIIKYYGNGKGAVLLDEPLPTVTTADRFALVQPEVNGLKLGILTRMLQPHELSAAHSFPRSYKFTGNQRDQVKQIGNSVPVELAAAHAHAALS